MKGTPVHLLAFLCISEVFSVCFVDNDQVGQLNDPPFNTLQFITGTWDQEQ